jgi:hypothetical protein
MIIATIYFEIKGRWVVVKEKVTTQKKKKCKLDKTKNSTINQN